MFRTACSCFTRSSGWRIHEAELGKRIRHVDKRGMDVVGRKGEICGALGAGPTSGV